MARKVKPLPLPPLSLIDKVIYLLWFVLCLVIPVSCVMSLTALRRRIALATDPDMLASASSGVFLFYIFILLFGMIMVVLLAAPWASLLGRKQPFFGNRHVKYGQFPYKNTYPLFYPGGIRRALPKNGAEWQTALHDYKFMLYCLLAAVLLYAAMLCPRIVLRADDSIVTYGVFNHAIYTCPPEDILGLRIDSDYLPNGNHTGRSALRFAVQTRNGIYYNFYPGSFSGATTLDQLDQMLAFRARVPQPVRVVGQEDLDDILTDGHYTAEEAAKIYEIFGMSEETDTKNRHP